MQKITGISDIQTDTSTKRCSFKIKKDIDWKPKVEEFAKTNTHLADWTLVEKKS